MTRALTPEKVGQIATAIAYAINDVGADPKAVLAAWSQIGSILPMATDLVALAVERRGEISADVREMVDRIRDQERP